MCAYIHIHIYIYIYIYITAVAERRVTCTIRFEFADFFCPGDDLIK